MSRKWSMNSTGATAPTWHQNPIATSEMSPEEAARLFFKHLLDNVGQFQQLYDGLFRWKMNNASSLPSFNVVRPHLVNLLLASAINSGIEPASASGPSFRNNTARDFVPDSIAALMKSVEPSISPAESFETAFESISTGNTSSNEYLWDPSRWSTENWSRPPSRRSDDAWDPDNLRSCYENLTPPSHEPKNMWLEKRLNEEDINGDFDFESNLALFEKIPLKGEAAAAASTSATKQSEYIERLFKRASK